MAEILLFHHALGRTSGVVEFADELRGAGHTVHVPDLYDGNVFTDLKDGIGYAQEVSFEEILDRGRRCADGLPSGIVYSGFSLGVMPAQMLAQTREGAKGALLFYSCLPVSEFGDRWPEGVPVQIHGMDEDPYFAFEGDLDAARDLVEHTERAELFLYSGDKHLFADPSTPDYDASASELLTSRVLEFLGRVD
jgi:dienelactone hydrolase